MNGSRPCNLCVFDLDGTLTDPKIGITKSFQYALSAFGIHEEADALTRHIGAPLRGIFLTGYGLSEADTETAVAKYREHYADKRLLENTVYRGIPEALRLLAGEGKQLAVATSKVSLYTHQILEHFGFDGFFAFVSGDDMDGSLTINGKNDIIRIALEHFSDVPKASAVMIGDRFHDMAGAKANGIDSIGVTWGYGSRAELEEAGAGSIVDSPEELCRLLIGK